MEQLYVKCGKKINHRMRRTGYLIDEISDMDNLYLAYYKASKGKHSKEIVQSYSKNLISNLRILQYQIRSGNISVGKYHYFTIVDPKQRQICAASFDERVLHHALMNICHPYFDSRLIFDTYATRPKKGIYAALEKGKKAAIRYSYVGKLDYRKYFDSISHDILKTKLRKLFKDNLLLSIFDQIIDSYSTTENCGIPIGNLTSQYFANYYLSDLDHFIKESMRIPVYLRYMDDMLLFEQDKELLQKNIQIIDKLSTDYLQLTLKSPIINKTSQGVSFLGYTLKPNLLLLNGRSKRRFKNKLHKYIKLLNTNKWNESEYQNHILPLLAFVKYAYTKRYRKNIIILNEGNGDKISTVL